MNSRVAELSLASIKALILFAILFCSIAVARSSWIISEPLIGKAVTIDLLVSLPIIYFLFIRRSSIPKITVVPVFMLGVLTASLLLPAGGRQLLDLAIVYAVPAIELFVAGYLCYRVYRTRAAYMADAGRGHDVMEKLRNAFVREIKPDLVARIAAYELALVYYAVFRWRSSRNANSFTYHRKNGSISMLVVFLFLMGAETTIVHVLLSQWSPTAAWVMTAASIYLWLQIAAHLKAVMFRPVQITEGNLLIRCGALGDAVIDLNSIKRVVIGEPDGKAPAVAARLVALGGFSKANVTLDLVAEHTLFGYYGIARTFRSISFYVDEPAKLQDAISDRMTHDHVLNAV